MKSFPRLSAALAALLSFGFIAGCSTDSSDTFIRDVSVNFSGFYTGRNNGKIVAVNTGSAITSLDLRQTGDRLEAVDNNGHIWRGSLGEVQNGNSSFELNGQTTAGTEATFSGNISSSDGGSTGSVNSASGTMQGTFIEPSRFSTFYAQATIPGTVDNGGGGTTGVTISPSSATVSANGQTQIFTATGGSGSYTWSISASSRGSLNNTSGSSVTYTRSTSGDNTITVADSTNPSATTSLIIAQP